MGEQARMCKHAGSMLFFVELIVKFDNLMISNGVKDISVLSSFGSNPCFILIAPYNKISIIL